MKVNGWSLVASLGLMAVTGGAPALAVAAAWSVEGRLYGKPKDGGKDATDISGLACASAVGPSRVCLIIDDESQGAQVVVLREGHLQAGDMIRLSHDVFSGKPLELDAEGVSYSNGFFYVVGSHGHPRLEEGKTEAEVSARTLASRHLYRIDLSKSEIDPNTGTIKKAPEIAEGSPLDRFIKAHQGLAEADRPLAENGLTIEGLAVSGGTLTVGFRGPTIGATAAVLDMPLSALFDGQPFDGHMRLLALGSDTSGKARGIRDLSNFAGGYVGIAGPVLDPGDKAAAIQRGDYALFWWDGRSAPVLRDLDGYGASTKPEAILPLTFDNGRLRALLLFDGPLNGRPTIVEVDLPLK